MPNTRRRRPRYAPNSVAWLLLVAVVLASAVVTLVLQPTRQQKAQLVGGGPQTHRETFSTATYEDINYTSANWSTDQGVLTLHDNALSEQALSRTIDIVSDTVAEASMEVVRSGGGTVEPFLSNDGGQTWEPVSFGLGHAFSSTGSKLRWKLILSRSSAGEAPPLIDELRITYEAILPSQVVSIDAADSAALAVAVSQQQFPEAGSAGALLLARGDDPVDAFAAAPLAAAARGPVLLTSDGRLGSVALEEAQRVAESRQVPVYVLGGPAVVSDAAISDLASVGFSVVARLAGRDRYATAARVAEQVAAINPAVVRSAYLTEASLLIDAFAAGPAASEGSDGVADVILLGARGSATLPDATKQLLQRTQFTNIVIVGGATSISTGAETQLRALQPNANVVRIAGVDRFETASELAAASFAGPSNVVLADGTFRSDSGGGYGPLLGALLAGSLRGPLLLTDDEVLPPATQQYLLTRRETLNTALLVAVPATAVLGEQVRNLI